MGHGWQSGRAGNGVTNTDEQEATHTRHALESSVFSVHRNVRELEEICRGRRVATVEPTSKENHFQTTNLPSNDGRA